MFVTNTLALAALAVSSSALAIDKRAACPSYSECDVTQYAQGNEHA